MEEEQGDVTPCDDYKVQRTRIRPNDKLNPDAAEVT